MLTSPTSKLASFALEHYEHLLSPRLFLFILILLLLAFDLVVAFGLQLDYEKKVQAQQFPCVCYLKYLSANYEVEGE